MRKLLCSIALACTLTLPVVDGNFILSTANAAESNAVQSKKLSDAAKARIEAMVAEAIAENKLPGCVICVGDVNSIVHLQAYGNKRVKPEAEPMTTDTVFDMASITKPVATGSSIMKLIEQGKLRLNDTVASIFPDFGVNGKEDLTILDLLVHRSGLIPDLGMRDYANGPEEAWKKICELSLTAPAGTTFKYSDVNFIVLGSIVEKLSGKNLNEFVRTEVFEPTGMMESGYLPKEELRLRAAPTETRNDAWMLGEVHDPRAYVMRGIAGHAGLFSTANDLAKYAQMFLNKGTVQDGNGAKKQVFAPTTLQLMSRGVAVPGGVRGLSWDKQSGYSSNKGDLLSDSAVGHGGFTGTVLWIDPEQDLFFVFLSNRVHPDGKGSVNYLAGQILNVIASDLASPVNPVYTGNTLTGLDRISRDNYQLLAGEKVGLITNHTAISRDGGWIVPMFAKSDVFKLTVLFSPEHGFEGKLDISNVGDSQDQETGLKIYSLYGATRRPTPEMIENIDTIVFDIQDIGARFYTYISTMGEAMRAAAEHKKKFVVLDRPNPINGSDVAGPMLDPGIESFVGYHTLPVQHGMTVGELAKMFKAEFKLDLDLHVVECEGWNRETHFESTGLRWINPSPNMRSVKQAVLYPGIGLLETTNISVGRGTDTPFEWIGAPWMNGMELARRLNNAQLPGIVFIPVEFTPTSSKHENTLCRGVMFDVIDREKFQSVKTGLVIAKELAALHKEEWETKSLNRLLGCKKMADAILAEKEWPELQEIAVDGVRKFLDRREKYLIYR